MSGAPVMGRTMSKHGFVTVVIGYRLAPATIGTYVCGGAVHCAVLHSLLFTLCALGLIIGRSLLLSFLLSLFSLLRTPPSPLTPWAFVFILMACIAVPLITIFSCLSAYRRRHRVTARHPEQARDVAQALKWVQSELKAVVPYADLERVFVSGHSAGECVWCVALCCVLSCVIYHLFLFAFSFCFVAFFALSLGAHLASLVSLDMAYMRDAGVVNPESFIKVRRLQPPKNIRNNYRYLSHSH